jgi:hypothetical protein
MISAVGGLAVSPVKTCTELMEPSGILDALDGAYEIVLGELRPSCIPDAASAEQNLANALAKLPTLTPGPPGTKAKMRLESSLAVQLPASAMYV